MTQLVTINTVIITAILALSFGVLITLLVMRAHKKKQQAKIAQFVEKSFPPMTQTQRLMEEHDRMWKQRNQPNPLPLENLPKGEDPFWSKSAVNFDLQVGPGIIINQENIQQIFSNLKKNMELNLLQSPLNMMDILPTMSWEQFENMKPIPIPQSSLPLATETIQKFLGREKILEWCSVSRGIDIWDDLPVYLYPTRINYQKVAVYNNTKMIIIKYAPDFELGNPALNEAILKVQDEQAVIVDNFIRQCIAKVFNETTLSLFIDTGGVLPKTDIEIVFKSPTEKNIKVMFDQKELGHATFITEFVEHGDADTVMGRTIETKMINVLI